MLQRRSRRTGVYRLEGFRYVPLRTKLTASEVASSASIACPYVIVPDPDADSDAGDVTEIEFHQEEIKEHKLVKLAFLGAKLGPDGDPWSS